MHEWKGFVSKDALSENLITWVFEEDSFSPIAKVKGNKYYSILADHLGTPIEAYADDGNLVWSRELNANGKVLKETGIQNFCPFLYQGQTLDNEIELAYNRFRYYDVEDGRYISQDPIGLAGGMAFYTYVGDSNSWLDPFGLSSYKNRKKQDVYALYDSEADFLAGKKPFYVGISEDAVKRLEDHKRDGRFVDGNHMVKHQDQIDYDKARGTEQKMIEDNGTKTGVRGQKVSSTNRGNKNNSFDKNRTDANGKAYKSAYDML